MQRWSVPNLPFLDDTHRHLGQSLSEWRCPAETEDDDKFPQVCRRIAGALGEAGIIAHVLPDADGRIDVRAVCLTREALGYESVLADTVLAMQGIGAGAIWMHGSDEVKVAYLPPIRNGSTIAAFALTEPETGSDVANITTEARKVGNDYVLNGAKTYISNAPFADHYVVVARTGEAPGSRGLSAFLVDAGTEGLETGAPIRLMAPHPVGPLAFTECRVPASRMLGAPGQGFKIAMQVFDIFRTSVGAAAVGMARRAMDATLEHVTNRNLFGGAMSNLQGVQTTLAEMDIDIDLATMAVYRAAWVRDMGAPRATREVSMAKLVGSEAAGRVIDKAVQLHGGMGVTRGSIVEQLYREVRPSRIYEGASEVQKMVIGREIVRGLA